MGDWKIKPPSSFPAQFYSVVEHSYSTSAANEIYPPSRTREAANALSERFRYWRFCLRETPTDRLHKLELNHRITCRIIHNSKHGWGIRVEVKPRFAALAARVLFATD